MKKLKRILGLVVFIPLGIILIVLAVANRQVVTLALNPFRPEDQVLALSAPFFIFLLIAVIVGMVVGSFVTWWNQGKYRKRPASRRARPTSGAPSMRPSPSATPSPAHSQVHRLPPAE